MTIETAAAPIHSKSSWSSRDFSFPNPRSDHSWSTSFSTDGADNGRRADADGRGGSMDRSEQVARQSGTVHSNKPVVLVNGARSGAQVVKVLSRTRSRSGAAMPIQSRRIYSASPIDGVPDQTKNVMITKVNSFGEKIQPTAVERGLLRSIKRMSLGCGLVGLAHSRRRLLTVAPVSRTPSQELAIPVKSDAQQQKHSQMEELQEPLKLHELIQKIEQPVRLRQIEKKEKPVKQQIEKKEKPVKQKKAEQSPEQPVKRDTASAVQMPWTEKYQPKSLSNFRSQVQTAAYLKHLISHGNCPHMIFAGQPGSGKRALIRAMLRDLFGQEVSRVRNVNRSFYVQGGRLPNFLVPVVTSAYHVEIDVSSVGDFAVEVLPTIIKDMSDSCAAFRDSSAADSSGDGFYKVLVLYQADRLSTDAQLVLRRCMNIYGDTCKVILSYCPDPQVGNLHVLEELESHCHYINVAPLTIDEIVKVLQYITQQEQLELPINLAIRVAIQSKQNLKQAILTLEACKAQKYPFEDDQMVQLGSWQKEIVKIAEDIISHPTPKQLFIVRPKLQAMLTNSIPATLVLQELQEELVENFQEVDEKLGKEVRHWAKHFDSKLTSGPDCIYQLEGFVAKIMSIYKKYLNAREKQWMTMVAMAPSNQI